MCQRSRLSVLYLIALSVVATGLQAGDDQPDSVAAPRGAAVTVRHALADE